MKRLSETRVGPARHSLVRAVDRTIDGFRSLAKTDGGSPLRGQLERKAVVRPGRPSAAWDSRFARLRA